MIIEIVTADKYELPLCNFDTWQELSDKLNLPIHTLKSMAKRRVPIKYGKQDAIIIVIREDKYVD